MIAIGIVFSFEGVGFLCWSLLTLAIHAVPVFRRHHCGHNCSGPIGGILVGMIVCVATLVAWKITFAAVRSPLLRAVIALPFALPAMIAGYYATLRLAHI